MSMILIVDDDPRFLQALKIDVERRGDLTVLAAKTGGEALELVRTNRAIRLVLLDYNYSKWGGPGQMNGLQVAEQLKAIAPELEIIMMSEVAGIHEVDDAHRIHHIKRFLDKSDLNAFIQELGSQLNDPSLRSEERVDPRQVLAAYGFNTRSDCMREVCQDAIDAAGADLAVLIAGESGTRKLDLARSIHAIGVAHGRRADRWVAVNCSTVRSTQYDAVLFGHSGNDVRDHSDAGAFAQAEGGTCFLNEVTEIPSPVQAVLEQILRQREEPAGVDVPAPEVDASTRIIASTNENIRDVLASGRIRRDLFYQFDLVLVVPPLRDRIGDLPELVADYLGRLDPLRWNGSRAIEPEAIALLQRQPWIGNDRQLLRVVKRASARARAGMITTAHIQRELRVEYGVDVLASSGATMTVDLARSQYVQRLLQLPRGTHNEIVGGIDAILEGFRKEIFGEMLKETNGNANEAAHRLGRSRLPAR